MVSPNEVDFNLREIAPPSRNNLLSWEISAPTDAGWRTYPTVRDCRKDNRGNEHAVRYQKDESGHLSTLTPFGIPQGEDWVER